VVFDTELRDTTIFPAQHIETFDFSERANRFDREEKIHQGWMDGWLDGKMGGNIEGWMEDGIDCYTTWSIDCLPLGVAWDGRHGYLMAHNCVGLFAEGWKHTQRAVVDDTRACCEE
jgi:hypothetical protein